MATLSAAAAAVAAAAFATRKHGMTFRASVRGSNSSAFGDSGLGRRVSTRRRGSGVIDRRRSAAAVVVVNAAICGIDLGTTNSAVAVVVDGRAVVVPDEEGHRTIPSIVTFLPEEGKVLVGHAARKRLTKDPSNTYHSVKRFIGKRFTDKRVAEDARRVPFEVVASDAVTTTTTTTEMPSHPALSRAGLGPKGDGAGLAALQCPALGRKVMPEEVSMHILRRLLDVAEGALSDGPITRAVITVPAYFDDDQCAATERAGKAAGLDKIKILHEPVAAAMAYGKGRSADVPTTQPPTRCRRRLTSCETYLKTFLFHSCLCSFSFHRHPPLLKRDHASMDYKSASR